MKPHERRRVGAYPYYSLAKWKEQLGCFVSSKKIFETEDEAKNSVKAKGTYRLIKITEVGRENLEIFKFS